MLVSGPARPRIGALGRSGRSRQTWLTRKVIRFTPDFAAAPSRSGFQSRAGRQPEPRKPGELLAALSKAAVKNECSVPGCWTRRKVSIE
jgi:hypothetical protein